MVTNYNAIYCLRFVFMNKRHLIYIRRRRVEQLVLDVVVSALTAARWLSDDPDRLSAPIDTNQVNGSASALYALVMHVSPDVATRGAAPALGGLVQTLRAALDQHVAVSRAQASQATALRSVGALGRAALLDACAAPSDLGTQVDARLRRTARIALARDISALERQLRSLRLAIETALLVLWRHVELSASSAAMSSATALSASLAAQSAADAHRDARHDAQLRQAMLTALRAPHAEPRASSFALVATLDGVGAQRRLGDTPPFAFAVARRLEALLASN